MKICAVTVRYPPYSMVGAWITTHTFLRDLRRRGHDVVVLTMDQHRTYELDGITVMPRNTSGGHLRTADVIVSHLGDDGSPAADAARHGVPSLRMVHGLSPSNRQRIERHPPALVVFNSRNTADAVGPLDVPSIVCHPPVDPDEYRTTPGDRVALVNIAAQKGGITFELAARAMPAVGFLGVRGHYLLQHSRRLPANVDLMDTVVDMRDVYSRTRILLMPSEKETWGRCGLEAMASGIPVIAHPTPGLVESLGDAGVFVDRDDRGGWVREIRRLFEPDEWAEASTRSLARSAECDPQIELDRFAAAVETLAGVAA